jgi:hypothetical protein
MSKNKEKEKKKKKRATSKGGTTPMHATITLDSGAFLEEVQKGRSYKELRVGYFGNGPLVPDLHILADGDLVKPRDPKLGYGTVEVVVTGDAGARGVEVTDTFVDTLLRKVDLYPVNTPEYDPDQFECTLIFTAGRFCCSMVKTRLFKEHSVATGMATGSTFPLMKLISHNASVHFDLGPKDVLELRRNGSEVLFSTADLPTGTQRLDLEVMAHNNTAIRFFRDALVLKGPTCLLPNQGDPPPNGSP